MELKTSIWQNHMLHMLFLFLPYPPCQLKVGLLDLAYPPQVLKKKYFDFMMLLELKWITVIVICAWILFNPWIDTTTGWYHHHHVANSIIS